MRLLHHGACSCVQGDLRREFSRLFNSEDLAEEVHTLEEYVTSCTDFELQVLTSICENDDPTSFLGFIRLGMMTEKIADAGRKSRKSC